MIWLNALPALNEGCMIVSAILVACGWRFIRQRRVPLHRRTMLAAVGFGAAFFVSYVVRTLLVGDTQFGGPSRWRAPYLALLQVHVTLATAAGVMGAITVRWALRGRFDRHRRLAPWTAVFWFVAAGSGLAVYLLLYVIFRPGPTTDVVRAITGH